MLLILLLYFPLRAILLDNTTRLETHLVATNANRAAEALNTRINSLARITRSYAMSDGTYRFTQDRDPAYVTTNHTPESFVNEGRDTVLIADPRGTVLLNLAIDPATGAPAPALSAPPPGLANPLFTHHSPNDLHAGLLWEVDGPSIVAASAILHSDGSGSIAGTLLFRRHLSPADIAGLGEALSLDLALFAANDAASPADVVAVQSQLAVDGTPTVRPLDEQRVAGYVTLLDVYGQPTIILRTVEERAIYAQGRVSTFYLGIALVVAVLVVGGAILLLLEHLVLARVARLSADMGAIGRDGDPNARLYAVSGDELGQLASAINATLSALDGAQQARRQEVDERLRLQSEVIQGERQLLSRVSHELRTPLTPIKGFVDLLLLNSDRTLTPNQLEVLQIVRGNTEHMIGLVDELIEIEQAQNGQLGLNLEPVAVLPVLARALEQLLPAAERKRLTITTTAETPPPIEADARRLEQILANLISNAVKYTPVGGVIELSARVSAPGYLTIAVRDTGIGLTADQQRRLFTPFFRADTPLHAASSGTGLGLLITRTLVELHQGRMEVQTTFGVGSTFSVILPLTQWAEQR